MLSPLLIPLSHEVHNDQVITGYVQLDGEGDFSLVFI